eukprot:1156870-Pelagomonas_calceolata.AAC.8
MGDPRVCTPGSFYFDWLRDGECVVLKKRKLIKAFTTPCPLAAAPAAQSAGRQLRPTQPSSN